MRVPISWLGDVVDLPEDVTLDHIHAALVKVGFEEEDVHAFAVTGPIVAGRVLSRAPEPQSNGKTINWCQVDVGESEPRGIVCGAQNFEAGDLVAVTLPGAVLPGPTPDEPFLIAARKTYGHVSDGMIASERELGLSEEHAGIIVLGRKGIDVPPGTDLVPILGLDDAAVEVNVTPDRGYALSIRGIGREYSLSTGAAYRDPAFEPGLLGRMAAADETLQHAGKGAATFPVTVNDVAPIRGRVGSDVFTIRAVRGIDRSRPTPPWMAARLKLAGMRSISLPVDVTNYVMLEFGQPIHGYDLDRLRGGIVVRRAEPGETLTTLDGQLRRLSTEDLLITDDRGAIGLAGVMGGLETEITDATTNILIEAAHFDQVSIARTARRYKLWSEASKRYERGVDPLVASAAAQRVVDLLVELGGGTADDTLGARLMNVRAREAIALPAGYIDGLIGVDYTAAEVEDTLRAIGCEVSRSLSERSETKAPEAAGWLVTPPSWRPDLATKADLAEEVARITGYDRIPSVVPIAPPGRGLTEAQRLRRAVAASLAGAGLVEVLTYPFMGQAEVDVFQGPGEAAVRLANPLDGAMPYLRRGVTQTLVGAARRNLSRGLTDLAIFEIGRGFQPEPGRVYGSDALPGGDARPDEATLTALYDSVPPQPWHLAALFTGNAVRRQPGVPAVPYGVADAVATARHLAAAIGVTLEIRQPAFDEAINSAHHPGRTAHLGVNGRAIGVAAELHPRAAAAFDLPRGTSILEIDLDALTSATRVIAPTPLSTYPAATQDMSLVVPERAVVGELLAAFTAAAGPLLEDARLVDVYRGQGIPEGTKSLTFALRFRAPDRTLTQAEATEAKLAGVAALGAFGAAIRD